MILSKEEDASKLLSLLGCFALTLMLLLSLMIAAIPAAAASQSVTLTFTSSAHTAYPVEELTINATASAPITGPVKLNGPSTAAVLTPGTAR